MEKIKSILGSVRFQQLLIVAVLQSLVVFNVINGDQGSQLIDIISGLFGASVLVGTIDRAAQPSTKKVSKKK